MEHNPFEKLKELDREQLKQNALKQLENHPQSALIQKVINKEKLTTKEQIAYLKYKGITFHEITESEAEAYLENNTYYYKVTVYRKNFAKTNADKYEQLEFSTLRDLAVIDMHLRYLLIQLSLDLEHAIKSKLVHLITNSDEDGYAIVDEYNQYQLQRLVGKAELTEQQKKEITNSYIPVPEKIMKDFNNPHGYHYDLFDKRHQSPAIWVLIELMSYGALASFIKFYVDKEKFGSKQLKDASDFMHYTKNVRDSAAHSRPIIFNIIGPEQITMRRPKLKIRSHLLKLGLPKSVVNKHLKNVKFHDLVSMMYLHDHYVKGSKARRVRKKEVWKLLQRIRREKHLYPESERQEFTEILSIVMRAMKSYST